MAWNEQRKASGGSKAAGSWWREAKWEVLGQGPSSSPFFLSILLNVEDTRGGSPPPMEFPVPPTHRMAIVFSRETLWTGFPGWDSPRGGERREGGKTLGGPSAHPSSQISPTFLSPGHTSHCSSSLCDRPGIFKPEKQGLVPPTAPTNFSAQKSSSRRPQESASELEFLQGPPTQPISSSWTLWLQRRGGGPLGAKLSPGLGPRDRNCCGGGGGSPKTRPEVAPHQSRFLKCRYSSPRLALGWHSSNAQGS